MHVPGEFAYRLRSARHRHRRCALAGLSSAQQAVRTRRARRTSGYREGFPWSKLVPGTNGDPDRIGWEPNSGPYRWRSSGSCKPRVNYELIQICVFKFAVRGLDSHSCPEPIYSPESLNGIRFGSRLSRTYCPTGRRQARQGAAAVSIPCTPLTDRRLSRSVHNMRLYRILCICGFRARLNAACNVRRKRGPWSC